MIVLKTLKDAWRKLFNNRKIKVIVLGDSNSSRPGPTDCWPAALRRKSQRRICLINDSVEGRTTRCEMFGPAASGLYPSGNRAVDFLFIMLGTNDAKYCHGPTTPQEARTNLNTIINQVLTKNTEIHIVILQPPPMGADAQGEFLLGNRRVQEYCREFRDLCSERNLPIIDIYSLLKAKEDLEPDAVHLNESGRRKITDASWDYIRSHIAENIE